MLAVEPSGNLLITLYDHIIHYRAHVRKIGGHLIQIIALIMLCWLLCALTLSFLSNLCHSCPSGKRVLIVGDDPISFGGTSPVGFMRLVENILKVECPEVSIDIEGERGWGSQDILSNIDRMVSLHKPTSILLLTGTVDTHRILEEVKRKKQAPPPSRHGVSVGLKDGRVVQRFDDGDDEEQEEGEYEVDMGLEPADFAPLVGEFHRTIQHIVSRALSAKVDVTIGSPLIYGEKINGNEHDDVFEDITGALLHVVVDNDLKYIDIRSELLKELETRAGARPLDSLNHNILTYDGHHLNEVGHMILRDCLLTSFFQIFSQSAGYVHQKSDSSLAGAHLCMHNERYVDEFEQRRNGILKRSDMREAGQKREALLAEHLEAKRIKLEKEVERLKELRRVRSQAAEGGQLTAGGEAPPEPEEREVISRHQQLADDIEDDDEEDENELFEMSQFRAEL